MKKTPLRLCVVTRESLPKGSLLRIVKTKDGKVSIDETFSAPGRGAYIKKDKEIILMAKKCRSLEKSFKCHIDSSIYDDLLKYIGG